MDYHVFISVLLIGIVNCQLRWERLDRGVNNAPSPRMNMGFGHGNNKIVVFGGNPGPLDDTWVYNLPTGPWRKMAPATAPEARFSMVSGVSGNYFYIATGEGKDKKFFNDIWRFDLTSEVWEELPAQRRPDFYSQTEWDSKKKYAVVPESRYGGAGGIYPGAGDDFWVSLGFASERYFNTFSYDTRHQKWQLEHCRHCNPYNPSYPHARCLHAGTMIDQDEIVIFGGCLGGGGVGGPCPAGDSWRFSGKTKSWTRLPDCAAPRMYGAMANLPSSANRRRVVLYGGLDKSDQVIMFDPIPEDQVAIFDPDTNSWTLRQTTADNSTYPAGRAMHGMATTSNGIYMFGGLNKNTGKGLNDLWLLNGGVAEADDSKQIECTSHFVNYITVHGILMVIGWGFFLQWGAFIARYLKFKNPLWFYLHVTFQIFGLCCAIAGLIMGILSVPFGHLKFAHSITGVVVMILGIMQPINAFIRPHKPEDGQPKMFKRRFWEFIHHFGGRAGLVLALVNISLGVFLAVAAEVIWALWFSYLGVIILAYVLVELVRSLKGRKTCAPRIASDKMVLKEGLDNNGIIKEQ